MSEYVDKFIRQHKEYFERNRKTIENNKWNNESIVNSKIEKIEELISTITESTVPDRDKQIYDLQKEIKGLIGNSKKNKASLFDQENKLTNSILGRLTAFIKGAEGDRNLPKTQKFIDSTVKIIRVHLNKCEEYLDYNTDVLTNETETEEEIEYNNQEIIFQDKIFTEKIAIENIISSLNISNSSENLEVKFYKNQKATIPMISVLPNKDPDIREATKKLNLKTKITDKEFFILKKEKDIPVWNHHKNYWEQDKKVLDFWWNEWLKMNQGFEIDGYFIHPWLYYHLNFFKTYIPVNAQDELMVPPLRDNEWYLAELLKEAERRKNRGILLYGSRRISKSTNMASICEWKALIKSGISTAITSGDKGDLSELTHKIRTSMENKVPAFQLYTHKQEWDGGTVNLGLKWDASTLIEHSRHTIKNLDGGAKSSTQKTAGGAPSVFLLEEIGKFKWKAAYTAAQPSFETPDGYKTTVILVGTGGEASLSVEAVQALSNPEQYKLLEMDWDLLEDKMPKSAITWKRRKFANFVPAQMGYKTGFKRIERGFGEFLGIKSTELDRIKILQTDWENNTRVLMEERESKKKDNFLAQQEAVQYPIDPEECFLSAEQNPFPYLEAKNHRDKITLSGDTGRKVMLTRNQKTGKIDVDNADERMLAEYPHNGSFIDSPGLLFGRVPDETPQPYTYVAGYDDYKQEESENSESVGTFYIKAVDVPGVKDRNKIVFSLSTRPDPHGKMHRQWLLALELFNAKAFGENADEDFKKHLTRLRVVDNYLVETMDFSSDLQITFGGKRKHGWTPNPKNIKFLFGLFVEYCKQEFEVEGEDGETYTVLGVELINDVTLLDEIINYKANNNVDRITAMMGALGYEFFLFNNYMFPKIKKQNESIEKENHRKNQPKNIAQRMFKTVGSAYKYKK